MSVGEPPPGDDDLWERLQRLPDADVDPPPDPRRFRLGAPSEPAQQPPAPQPQTPVGTPQPSSHPGAQGPAHPEVAGAPPLAPLPPGHQDSGHHDGPEPIPQHDVPAQPRTAPRRRWPKVVLALVALGALVTIGFVVWAWVLWERIDRVDTAGSLSPASDGFTNYLIVGTDSRAGVDPDLETAASIGLGIVGERSDTMLVLHIGDDGNHMVSLPRDLWVQLDSGSADKLNAARALDGVPGLVRTIRNDPGIPIHRYLEVDIAGFLGVIEAVGDITIDFPSPACDPKSGLDVRATGPVALGPEQALAYVRSRTYTEFDAAAAQGMTCSQLTSAGLGRVTGGNDIGRTERQRRFLLAVFDRAAGNRNPVTALSVLSGIGGALSVDDGMGLMDAIGLFRDLRGLDATTHALPVTDLNVNGASALALRSDAPPILDIFRGQADPAAAEG